MCRCAAAYRIKRTIIKTCGCRRYALLATGYSWESALTPLYAATPLICILKHTPFLPLYGPGDINTIFSHVFTSRPFVLAEAPRPDTADVYLQTDPDFGNITLRSNTQTKFIRANNFNYSNASASSINAVYAGSIPADFVPELNINDIIIVGHSSAADGVFQVADIRRENIYGGYVRLNYKGIAHAN